MVWVEAATFCLTARGEEGFDLGLLHVGGMAFGMEDDEAPDPGQVALFGAIGFMFAAQDAPGTFEQLLGRHKTLFLKPGGKCYKLDGGVVG